MIRKSKGFVSAFLPVLPLAFSVGCGSGGGSNTAQTQAATPVISMANKAPSIAAIADEHARVGQLYNYLPNANDPDGDSLSFTALNLPPWASIDARTGRVSGTPGANDYGVYESITITVADAGRQTMTAPFTITVIADISTGTASLRWEMPPSKVDGSPLDDLAGYRILYGRNSKDLDHSVLIDEPSTTSYEFTSLESGTWYFAVVAVNSGGLEGPPTVAASKSI